MTEDLKVEVAKLMERTAALEQRVNELDLPALQRRLGQLFGGNGAAGEHGILMTELNAVSTELAALRAEIPRPWTDLQKALWAVLVIISMGVSSWWFSAYMEEQHKQDQKIQELSGEIRDMRSYIDSKFAAHNERMSSEIDKLRTGQK